MLTINEAKAMNDEMVLRPEQRNAGICLASVSAIEECFKRMDYNYIRLNDADIVQHAHFMRHVQTGPRYLPFLLFQVAKPQEGRERHDNSGVYTPGLGCLFMGGRHTFCLFRDSGLKQVRIATEHCRARIAIENGFELIPEDKKAKRFVKELKEQKALKEKKDGKKKTGHTN